MNGRRSKAGYALIEGAIIFPLISITVICLIQMLVYSYQMLEEKIKCDAYARHAAGRLAATSYLKDTELHNESAILTMNQDSVYRELKVQKTSIYESRFMAKDKRITEASNYMAINESRILRNIDLIADGILTLMDLREKQHVDTEIE